MKYLKLYEDVDEQTDINELNEIIENIKSTFIELEDINFNINVYLSFADFTGYAWIDIMKNNNYFYINKNIKDIILTAIDYLSFEYSIQFKIRVVYINKTSVYKNANSIKKDTEIKKIELTMSVKK